MGSLDMSFSSDHFSHKYCYSLTVPSPKPMGELTGAFRAKRTFDFQVLIRVAQATMKPPFKQWAVFLPQAAKAAPPSHTSRAMGQISKLWLFPVARSLHLVVSSEDWQQTMTSSFIHSNNKHLLSIHLLPGPKIHIVLGAESTDERQSQGTQRLVKEKASK